MPEHVRIRYAWMLSGTVTLIIIIFWLITLAAQKPETPENDTSVSEGNIMEDLGIQKESIKDAAQGMKKTFDNGKANPDPALRQ